MAVDTYGPFPGNLLLFLDIPGKQQAVFDVVELLNDALNDDGGVASVGADELVPGAPEYLVAWDTGFVGGGSPRAFAWQGSVAPVNSWSTSEADPRIYQMFEERKDVWAVFTPIPEPGTVLLMGLGLAGLGLTGHSRREEGQGAA